MNEYESVETGTLEPPGPTLAGGRTGDLHGGSPSAGGELVAGIDIGGTKLLGVVSRPDGTLVAETRLNTPATPRSARDATAVFDAVVNVVDQLETRAKRALSTDTSMPSIGRLGVGAPGMVDEHGVLRFAPNLPAASGHDLKTGISHRLPAISVTVDNDANCALRAERAVGAAQKIDHVLMVTLGTGIGGAFLVNGELLYGGYHFAGEIGHMIVDPGGPPCPCGRRGCWERFASGSGLARLGREAAVAGHLRAVVAEAGGDPEAVRGEQLTEAALARDPEAIAVFRDLGWWLALGLANLTAAVDPQLILIGGGLVATGDLLLEPTRDAYRQLVEGHEHRPDVPILAAHLRERAGAIGAAMLAGAGLKAVSRK